MLGTFCAILRTRIPAILNQARRRCNQSAKSTPQTSTAEAGTIWRGGVGAIAPGGQTTIKPATPSTSTPPSISLVSPSKLAISRPEEFYSLIPSSTYTSYFHEPLNPRLAWDQTPTLAQFTPHPHHAWAQ